MGDTQLRDTATLLIHVKFEPVFAAYRNMNKAGGQIQRQTMAKSADVDSCRWGLQSRLLNHLPSLIYDVQYIVNGLLNVPAIIAMQRSGWPEVVIVIVRSLWELDFVTPPSLRVHFIAPQARVSRLKQVKFLTS